LRIQFLACSGQQILRDGLQRFFSFGTDVGAIVLLKPEQKEPAVDDSFLADPI
jgi:hypothetical protein